MTLGELSTYICTKLGQADEASVVACKLFLRRRYQMIWDSALWKESLFTRGIATGNGICVLPATCDQVVALRIDDRPVGPLDQPALMRYDPGAFVRTGAQPDGFVFLSPTCLSAQILGSTVIGVRSTSVNDTSQILHVVGETGLGMEVREALPLTGTTVANTTNGFSNVLSATLSAPCEGDVTILSLVADLIPAGNLSLDPHPRVKILEYGSGTITATFLCKRRFTDLLEENDTPILRNCENALLAFASGDMLERQRQYAKAQLKIREGEAQLQILLDLEKNQSASEQRIVPADISGAPMAYGFGAYGKEVW